MARKLNTALVAAVASVAVLGGAGYMAAPKIIRLIRPDSKLIAIAEEAEKRGDYVTAAVNYGKVASRNPGNVEYQLRAVDAGEYTVQGDIDKLRTLRQQESNILTNDPRSVPALRRVLAYQKSDVQRNPADTASVRSLSGTADRLEKLVPGDREARFARITSVVEPYNRNLETKPEEVDAALADADKLFEENPDDADACRIAVQMRLVPIQRALQQGDAADYTTRLKQATEFVDAAVARVPQNAGAWVGRADVYRLSLYLPGKKPEEREALAKASFETMQKSLQKANELVKPGDALFLPIRTSNLKQLELRDPKAAEAGFRKLLTEMPDDRQPRLMLAEFLTRQPARRDDAVAVLEAPFKPTKPLRALDSVEQRLYGQIEQVRRAAIRLGALSTVADPADRKKRIEIIDAEYRALSSDPDISTHFKPAVLRVQGGLEIARGKVADGINTLDSALKLMNPDTPSTIEQDIRNDALMEYVQAQLRLNQTGQARPALIELVKSRSENLAARAMLADLLLRERNFDGAREQVEFLQKFAGDAPIVQQMALQLQAEKGTLKDSYAAMAEDTRDRQYLKMRAAATLNDLPEMNRLAKKMIAVDPADIDGVTAFVQNADADNRSAEAEAVLAAALKARPDDARLLALSTNRSIRTPAERFEATKARIEKITDPYDKTLATGEVARAQGRPGDAIESYKAAQKINPSDPRAFEGQFQLAVLSRRFADAEAVLGDLARLGTDQAGGALRKVQLAAARAAVEADDGRRVAMFKEVAAQAQAVAAANGELATATLLYAQVLTQSGDLAGAIDQFSQTLDKAPTNVDAAVGIADCLMRTDRRAEAYDRVNAARALAPRDPRVGELALTYELKFGDPSKALDALTANVDKTPTDPNAAARLALALEQVAQTRKGDEAKSFLTRAADVHQKAFARFPQDLRFLAAYAELERRLDQPAVAEKAVEKVAADPAYKDRPEVAQLLADQYLKSNKIDEAAAVLVKLIDATKPPPADAVQRLAMILARANRVPEALSVLDRRADDAGTQRVRVNVLVDAGRIADARQAVEGALAAHPDADTNLLAAYVELRGNDFAKSESFANKTLALRPYDTGALYYRAQAKLNGTPPNVDAALADLTRARDAEPTNVEVRLTLAEVYRRRGDRDAAVAELQQAWVTNHAGKGVLLRLVEAYSNMTPPAWTAVARAFEEAKATPQLAKDFDVLLAEAETFAARNDKAGAVAAGRVALAVAPDSLQAHQKFLELLLRAKAYREAVVEADVLAKAVPDAWWVSRARGLALRGLGQSSDAAKALDTAFTQATATADPGVIGAVARAMNDAGDTKAAVARLEPFADPGLRLLAAELRRDGGDNPGAIARFEALVVEGDKLPAPTLRRAQFALGQAYLQNTPPEAGKARPLFEALLKSTPDDVALLNNYANVLLMPGGGGTPPEALKPAQRAYELLSKAEVGGFMAVVSDTYGWALVKNNRAGEAVDILRRAADTATFPDVFVHLAEAYLVANNLDGAEGALGDARTRLDENAKLKRPVDPALQTRYAELTEELAKKRAATPGGE